MMTREWLQRFMDEIVSEGIEYENFSVLRAAFSEPDVAILVYSWHGDEDVLYGQIYRTEDIHQIYNDDQIAPEVYASDLVVHDFDSPNGPGTVRNFAWERKLDLGTRAVHWHYLSADYSDLSPELHYVRPPGAEPRPREPHSIGLDPEEKLTGAVLTGAVRYRASYTPLAVGDTFPERVRIQRKKWKKR